MRSFRHFVKNVIVIMILTVLWVTALTAGIRDVLNTGRYDIIKLDTLDYESIYVPLAIKNDFPYDITGSRAIKDAYKIAQENKDGYMIYLLSILEFEQMYTWGNLNPGWMLRDAFDLAKESGDSRLAMYVLTQQLRYNLFSSRFPESYYRNADSLATACKDTVALLELADYLEDLKDEGPSPKELRAKAYGFMDPVLIKDVEFDVFWTDFSHFCKNMDANDVDRYINTELTVDRMYFEEAYFHRDYTCSEIAKILTNKDDINNPLPEWETEMDSLSTARPLIRRNLGDSGAISWSISPAYENPDHVFNYRIGHDGPVSFTTAYYFKKFDGKIKLFKIVYDEY